MIINFPTSLYASILPAEADDLGNITWTISSNDPPRTQTVVPIILQSDQLRPLPPRSFTPEERAVTLGEFIFNLSYSKNTIAGLGNKTFEVGQLLDFDDVDDAAEVQLSNLPEIIEIQQNTGLLDLDQLGLNEIETHDLESKSRERLNQIISELNSIRTSINITKTNIRDNQKLINEAKKARNAAEVVLGSDSDVVGKLTSRESELLIERDNLISQLNELSVQESLAYQSLLTVREVVR